jgi:hypothetical protein
MKILRATILQLSATALPLWDRSDNCCIGMALVELTPEEGKPFRAICPVLDTFEIEVPSLFDREDFELHYELNGFGDHSSARWSPDRS